MFYKKILKTKKTKSERRTFDEFSYSPQFSKNEESIEEGKAKVIYNFNTENNSLSTGYGFRDLQMPESTDDLEDESVVQIRGNEVRCLWKLKWYNSYDDKNNYYLFYFNNEKTVCYDNMFGERNTTLIIPVNYTSTPYAIYCRRYGSDALFLSGKGAGTTIITGTVLDLNSAAPVVISICSHYGKFFAITAEERGKLVYTDETDILGWYTEQTSKLDFSDERGDLNRIISFNDYVYIFRDYGITKLSVYSADDEFTIDHIYLSDGYIFPDTISQTGNEIYFYTEKGLKVFNGTNVKDIELDCISLLQGCDNQSCNGVCFLGKYYLACRGNFDDDEVVGCEEDSFKNNMIIVYDIQSKHTDIIRGVDVKQFLALLTPYKSKLVACFNGANIGKIGELIQNGKAFNNELTGIFKSGIIDFDLPEQKKKITDLIIKSEFDCTVEIKNEESTKKIEIKGKSKIQNIKLNFVGKQFELKIKKIGANANIANLIIKARIAK